jgi:hypothetical protein
MVQPRLKHFGWGREGEGLTTAEEAFVSERIEQQFGPLADGEVKPPRLRTSRSKRPASIHPRRCRSARPPSMTVQHIPTANHFLIMYAGLSAITATHRMWSPIRAPRRRS